MQFTKINQIRDEVKASERICEVKMHRGEGHDKEKVSEEPEFNEDEPRNARRLPGTRGERLYHQAIAMRKTHDGLEHPSNDRPVRKGSVRRNI